MSFFRYPGGKSKLKKEIISKINISADLEYREPFFGGGSIGCEIIDKHLTNKIWINDKDFGISCLWTATIQYPNLLKSLVKNFIPSIEKFDEFKNILTSSEQPKLYSEFEISNYGFMKLAIHQISYSGLGTMSGGPLGGRKSDNVRGANTNIIKYPIDCRWSPDHIYKKIDKLHKQFSSVSVRLNKCTNCDFVDVICDNKHDAIIYLDPPYYKKGNDLYQHGFNEQDHIRLSRALQNTKHQWVLSYDDCPEVRKIYNWAIIKQINNINYSIKSIKNKDTGINMSRNKTELLICPKNG